MRRILQISFNEICEVQLTTSGRDQLDEYAYSLDDLDYDTKTQILRIPLWELMGIFGPMMTEGYSKLPFAKNRIEIEIKEA